MSQSRRENKKGTEIRITRSSSRDPSANSKKGLSTKRSATDREQSSVFKRKLINSDGQVPTIKRRKFGDKLGDSFCWICHKLAEIDEYICPDCPRIYHNKCIKKSKSEPLCECKDTEGGTAQNDLPGDFYQLLLFALIQSTEVSEKEKKNKKLQTADEFQKLLLWPRDWPRNNLLCKVVDTQFILDKIDNKMYTSYSQSVEDVKWMYHNCCIAFGFDDERTTLALKFLKSFKREIQDLDACNECYREKSDPKGLQEDFFVKVCSKPHEIVWAKLKGFKFWPAKCLRIVNGHADVRFFGTHDMSYIQLVHNKKPQVYKISRRNPSGNVKTSKRHGNSSYEDATLELNSYVYNYRHQFGDFKFYPDKTPLVEKPGKGKNKKKNKDQQEDHTDTDVNSPCDSNVPLLNISLLHDETEAVTDSKAVCRGPFPPSMLENLSERNNEDLVAGNMNSSYIQMIFQADEGTSGNQEEQPIKAVSNAEDSDFLVNVTPSQILLNNVEASVSTSDVPCLISSTESLSPSSSDIAQINASSLSCSEESIRRLQSIMENPAAVSSDDDDVTLISERNTESLVTSVFRNKNMCNTLVEILLANKPNIRNHIATFQNHALMLILKMWLEVNNPRLKVQDIRMIYSLYEKLVQARSLMQSYKEQKTKLNEENEKLRRDNEELRQKNSKLQEENDQLIQDRKNFKITEFAKVKARKNEKDLQHFWNETARLTLELKQKTAEFNYQQLKKDQEFKEKTADMEEELEELKNENHALKERLGNSKDGNSKDVDFSEFELIKEIRVLRKKLEECTCSANNTQTVEFTRQIQSTYTSLTAFIPSQPISNNATCNQSSASTSHETYMVKSDIDDENDGDNSVEDEQEDDEEDITEEEETDHEEDPGDEQCDSD